MLKVSSPPGALSNNSRIFGNFSWLFQLYLGICLLGFFLSLQYTYIRWAPGRQDTFLVAHASGQLYTYQVWTIFHLYFISWKSNWAKFCFCRLNLSAVTCLLCTNSKSRVSQKDIFWLTLCESHNYCWATFWICHLIPDLSQLWTVKTYWAQVRVLLCSPSRERPSGIRLPGDYILKTLYRPLLHFENRWMVNFSVITFWNRWLVDNILKHFWQAFTFWNNCSVLTFWNRWLVNYIFRRFTGQCWC